MTADRQLDGISECSADYSVSYFFCGSTVSFREEQPRVSSTVSCFSSPSATVSLTNRHSITDACISPMYLRNTFQPPKKRKLLSYKDAYLLIYLIPFTMITMLKKTREKHTFEQDTKTRDEVDQGLLSETY